MGILNSVFNFVFPLQRQRLHYQSGIIRPNQSQFHPPQLGRRFSNGRLWLPNSQNPRYLGQRTNTQVLQNTSRRPFARTLTPSQAPTSPVRRSSLLSEMFSSDMHLPSQRPQQKKSGLGGKVLNAMRWSNVLFR